MAKLKACSLYLKGLCVAEINPQPRKNFFESKGVKDGLSARCKACIKEIAHKKRLEKGGGKLRVPKRPKAKPVKEKFCSRFITDSCASFNPQPIRNFRAQIGRVNGRSQCISCENAYTKANSEKAKKRSRKWNKENRGRRVLQMRMKLYGLSQEQFDSLVTAQNNQCAICLSDFSKITICVDHCHDTGRVRGLLCHKCNRGLGFFKDSAEKLKAAIEYLSLEVANGLR